MTILNGRLAATLTAVAALAASGCVTLVPKTAPAQLYTFAADPGAPAAPKARAPVQVGLAALGFVRSARTDGIVTRTGSRVAKIAGVRWAAPADVLFERVLKDVAEGSGLILTAHAPRAAGGVLAVEVRTFEAVYPAPGQAPAVTIALVAALTPAAGGPPRVAAFRVTRPANANRVSAIVAAFAGASREICGEVVAWASGAQERPAVAA